MSLKNIVGYNQSLPNIANGARMTDESFASNSKDAMRAQYICALLL